MACWERLVDDGGSSASSRPEVGMGIIVWQQMPASQTDRIRTLNTDAPAEGVQRGMLMSETPP